jgi:hypothetical protein
MGFREDWGLRPKNEIVMASLDVDVRKYLNSMDRWFEYLENYRHALAHQIPLYIPPYGPRPGHEGRCRELEVALAELHGDLVELEVLRRERDQLILFKQREARLLLRRRKSHSPSGISNLHFKWTIGNERKNHDFLDFWHSWSSNPMRYQFALELVRQPMHNRSWQRKIQNAHATW